MTLVLEIEFLLGVSFATVGPYSDAPEWPPQPDRIFSALVAAWSHRGGHDGEASALRWLEAQPPPRILASEYEPRQSVTVFVPSNDPRSDKKKHNNKVLPTERNRNPRRFPAARPHDRMVKLFWPDTEVPADTLSALQDLARHVAYVGHSASLTRCRFTLENDAGCPDEATSPERRVYAGRIDELCQSYESGRRPLPGAHLAAPAEPVDRSQGIFSRRWLILDHVAGVMPDQVGSVIVTWGMRNALLSGYRRIGLGDEIPEAVSGHSPDGQPSTSPHLAIIPMPFVGFPYADGHVMGFALVPPGDGALLRDETFLRVLRCLAPLDEDHGRRVLSLATPTGTPTDRAFSIALSPTFEAPAGKRSLDPALYTARASVFATVTPIALDRHLKKQGAARQAEIEGQIATACRNVGLPEPQTIRADKHSALEGVASAHPSGNSPRWTAWRVSRSIASRQLMHAVIRFRRPVEGPVILGAGRFLGLGLCRPLDGEGR